MSSSHTFTCPCITRSGAELPGKESGPPRGDRAPRAGIDGPLMAAGVPVARQRRASLRYRCLCVIGWFREGTRGARGDRLVGGRRSGSEATGSAAVAHFVAPRSAMLTST